VVQALNLFLALLPKTKVDPADDPHYHDEMVDVREIAAHRKELGKQAPEK